MNLRYFRQLEEELDKEEEQAIQEILDASSRQLGKLRLTLVRDRRITLGMLKRIAAAPDLGERMAPPSRKGRPLKSLSGALNKKPSALAE